MTRRDLFRSAAAAVPAAAWGPAGYPGTAYREYSRCLPDYLTALAEAAYRRRNRELARLTTPERIRRRQRWVRETFWRLTGGMPERRPLNAKVVGSFERERYRVEKIIYESRPRFFVPANLYLPKSGRPPYPGVLFQMGHALNGKAAAAYQKCCQGLVQLGYVVLAFDPMGQGERAYYPRESGYLTRLDSADDEHTVPGKQMLLAGDTSSRLQVWDAVRSLDYLAAHPLVDRQRLASTGNSGGGTLTMMLAAVDDRLAAAAASCPNTENLACANFNPPGATDDAEQNFVNAGAEGFARWDLFYPLAPKPLLILVSARDFFGTYSPNYIANGWEEFGKLRRVYETLGHPERIEWADTPLPHGLAYNMRLRIYDWFGRWLKGESGGVAEEPPVHPEPDETLWCTEMGSVVRSLRSETPFTLNRARAAGIRTPAEPGDLAGLLGVETAGASPKAAVLGRAVSAGVDVEAIEVASADRVWVPAWLFLPRRPDPAKPAVIALEPAGRSVRWQEDELYQELAARGFAVCLPDVRGLGDLRPEFPRGSPQHARWHQAEEAYAWSSLILGKPLLGQRVTDIVAVVRALRGHPAVSGRRIAVAARGTTTPVALFAAALEPDIFSLYLAGGLVSYRNLVETEVYSHPLANFLPGVLDRTDLPQVAAAVGPRRIRLAGAVDGAGQMMPVEEVRRIYAAARNVEVLPAATWDAAALGDWQPPAG